MDIYLQMLRRAFPGVDLRISEHKDWNQKNELTLESITITIANRKIRNFKSFQQFVDYINYLLKDELLEV